MSYTKAMGEVVRLPVRHADPATDPAPDLDAPPTMPGDAGAGVPPTDPPLMPVPSGNGDEDDGEVIEFSQQGFEQKPFHRALVELGGHGVGDTDHMVTETLIRGMYEYWRGVMEKED